MPNIACGTAGGLLTVGTGSLSLNAVNGVGDSNIVNVSGTGVSQIGGGVLSVNIVDVGGTAISLVSAINSNITQVGGTNVTATSGVMAVNTTQFVGGAIPTPNVTGVPLVDVKYSKGTLSAGVAGYFGPDWNAINAPTSTVGLTNTTISSGQTITAISGAVGSVTGAVGSVTGNVGGNVTGTVSSVSGAVGSVTGAVGSVTGNVGGNVIGTVSSVSGAVGSVTSTVTANTTKFNGQNVTLDGNNLLKVDVEDYGGTAGTFSSGIPSENTIKWAGVNVTGMPMPTYTQPSGFLSCTFPTSGTVSVYAGGAADFDAASILSAANSAATNTINIPYMISGSGNSSQWTANSLAKAPSISTTGSGQWAVTFNVIDSVTTSPILGAQISAVLSNSILAYGWTNSLGQLTLNLNTGTYTYLVGMQGYYSQAIVNQPVTSNSTVTTFDLVALPAPNPAVSPNCTLWFYLFNSDSTPRVNCCVSYECTGSNVVGSSFGQTKYTYSSSSGLVQINALQNSTFSVGVKGGSSVSVIVPGVPIFQISNPPK